MKFFKLAAVIATAACLYFSKNATANDISGAPEAAGTRLHVTGFASLEAPPDVVTATLTAHANGGSASSVQAETNEMSHKVMALVRNTSDVTASASAYSVFQNGSTNDNTRKNWEARQTIFIKSKNAETLLPLIGHLQSAGLLLEGMNWSLSDDHRKTLTREAEKLAIKDMLLHANDIAGELSLKVGTVADVTVDEIIPSHPVMFMARSAATPVSTPEIQKITATVRAVLMLR
ncbi:SIMPL domain-containing protein [Acetobacter oeni]|uniref:SIMPL domain-containing protein n=1 Tax=Acetobacter oeni TaxID=304077 RepID=A0A511XJK9_9PROT|nr:SIMPL domain-containing protein [Acetobacter oeni]MBB3883338.1 uncharacterized protein YggE [Acetobacter oeni]NHO19494.1 DUF541 domain-containing protein [Acetobacter oeni]GBR00809.1 hypothetical protein AA21952_0222 [Acetobacter oeni LMG 21952]GEN63119.1 hypothetical protein AOE01nite_13430 [Acetobacter oeni]